MLAVNLDRSFLPEATDLMRPHHVVQPVPLPYDADDVSVRSGSRPRSGSDASRFSTLPRADDDVMRAASIIIEADLVRLPASQVHAGSRAR